MSSEALQLLRTLPEPARRRPPKETVLIALQHLLPSILHLFERTLGFGFRAENVSALGKHYSTIRDTEHELSERLRLNVFATPSIASFEPGEYTSAAERYARTFWEQVCARIGTNRDVIVLDEGGLLRRTMPTKFLTSQHRIVAIEHTSSGRTPEDGLHYPLILTSRSFAKLRFESPFIAAALVRRLISEIARTPTDPETSTHEADVGLERAVARTLADKTVGIIGFGPLGSAVWRHLRSLGLRNLLACDKCDDAFSKEQTRDVVRCGRGDLINRSDIILGCTGSGSENIASVLFGRTVKHQGTATERSRSPKTFGSCSSGDREFAALIPHLLHSDRKFRANAFDNASGQVGECAVALLNGGFPLNFDRRREYEPFDRICLTRELTFASIVQAHCMLTTSDLRPRLIRLDPGMQMEIVTNWVRELKAEAGFDVDRALSPAECPRIGIPHEPPGDLAAWCRQSEGEGISF